MLYAQLIYSSLRKKERKKKRRRKETFIESFTKDVRRKDSELIECVEMKFYTLNDRFFSRYILCHVVSISPQIYYFCFFVDYKNRFRNALFSVTQ